MDNLGSSINDPSNSFSHKDQDLLQEHVQRVQSLFLDLMDDRVKVLHDSLNYKEQKLEHAKQDRQHALVSLGEAWIEVDKANLLLSKLNEKLHLAHQKERINDMESHSLNKAIQLTEKEKLQLQKEIEETKKQLQESQKKIEHLSEINMTFATDLKIQKRTQFKTKKENKQLEQSKINLETELNLMQKKFDNAVQKKNELLNLLQIQQNETRVAQNVIARMSHEINKATDLREIQRLHWEEAMNAMNKRDTSLKSVVELQNKTKEELIETQIIQKSTQQELNEVTQKCQSLEKELEMNKKLVNQYHHQVKELESDFQVAKEDAKQAQLRIDDFQKRFIQEQELHSMYKEKYDQTCMLLNEVKANLQKKEIIDKAYVNALMDSKVEAKALEKDRKQKDEMNLFQNQENTNAQLSNVNASLVYKYNALQNDFESREKEHALLQSRNEEIYQQLEKVVFENQSLTYRLDKKDAEFNTFKFKHRPTDTKDFELKITHLEHEIKRLKKEKDDMLHTWLKLQQANTVLEKEVQRLTLENEFLQTQKSVHQATQGLVNNEIKEIKKDSFEANLRITKLHVELERLRPRLKELEERNQMLESQLLNREYTLKDTEQHFGDMQHLLKFEINRVTKDKLHLQKERMEDSKSYCALEQRYIVKKEMLEKAKKEKIDLLKQNELLKSKIGMLSTKVKELKKDWKILNDMGVSHFNRQKEKMKKNIEENITEEYKVVDLPALKLRIETLTLENKHLLGQIELSKSQALMAERKQLSFEKQITSLNMQLHVLEKEFAAQQLALTDTIHRAEWAEKICALLECQLKESAPNKKVDYLSLENTAQEPSTSLLAALNSRPRSSQHTTESLPPLKQTKKGAT